MFQNLLFIFEGFVRLVFGVMGDWGILLGVFLVIDILVGNIRVTYIPYNFVLLQYTDIVHMVAHMVAIEPYHDTLACIPSVHAHVHNFAHNQNYILDLNYYS